MKKTMFLLWIVIFFTSCTELKDNERWQIKGSFVNTAGEAINNLSISTFGSNNRLGFGQSDENGSFSIVSLVPNTDNLEVIINEPNDGNEFEHQPQYISPTIFFVDGAELSSPLFDFGEITIFEQSQLQLSITKTSTNSATLDWNLSFQEANCIVQVSNQENIFNISVCSEQDFTAGTQTDSTPNMMRNILSLRSSTATFTYSLNGAAPVSQNILLDQPNNSFSFEY